MRETLASRGRICGWRPRTRCESETHLSSCWPTAATNNINSSRAHSRRPAPFRVRFIGVMPQISHAALGFYLCSCQASVRASRGRGIQFSAMMPARAAIFSSMLVLPAEQKKNLAQKAGWKGDGEGEGWREGGLKERRRKVLSTRDVNRSVVSQNCWFTSRACAA